MGILFTGAFTRPVIFQPFTASRLAALIPLLVTSQVIAVPVADSETEEEFFAEYQVVLNATRLRQPVESAPAAITVIDREMIEASSATTIPELLRYIPGFQVSYLGGNEIIPGFHGIA
ncbi:TonB-dependent receptor plug domain-containing protein, partial [Solemya elarraichensis gill symbiont]